MVVAHGDPRIVGPRDVTSHRVEWIAGAVGAIAVALGAWIYYGPRNGRLTLFGWEVGVADLDAGWPLGLLVVGGLLLAFAFTGVARTLLRRDDQLTPAVVGSALLAIAAASGAVLYLLLWVA